MATSAPLKPNQLNYGSDKHGLVWGYLFTPGVAARQVDVGEVTEFFATPSHARADSFLWLHFSLVNLATVPWLHSHLTLPDSFFASLQEVATSTTLEQEDEALVAVIHDVLYEFNFDAADIYRASLCIEPRILVSARSRSLRSMERLHSSVKRGQSFRSPCELLAQLLNDQAHVLTDILRQSTVRIDAIEDMLLANRITISRAEVGALRRMLVRLQRLLAPEPTAFFRLLSRPPAWINEDDLDDLRHAAEEFSAALADMAALIERVKLIQEELMAMRNEQTNRTLYVLTVVTVLALPINIVAGLFGMNVGGIPLTAHPYGFLSIVVTVVVLTLLLAYLALGRRRE